MVLYRIKVTKRAKRDLKKLDLDVKQQITQAIEELAMEPYPTSSKPMKGSYKGYWRKMTTTSSKRTMVKMP